MWFSKVSLGFPNNFSGTRLDYYMDRAARHQRSASLNRQALASPHSVLFLGSMSERLKSLLTFY
jgi:hypothetical protein